MPSPSPPLEPPHPLPRKRRLKESFNEEGTRRKVSASLTRHDLSIHRRKGGRSSHLGKAP